MKSNLMVLKDLGIELCILIFSILLVCGYFIKIPSIENIVKFLEVSVTITTIMLGIINFILWKKILRFISKHKLIYQFLEKYECPILYEKYSCLIEYECPKGTKMSKESIIKINQKYTSISITLYTNEIDSSSVTAEIVKENDQFILYYIYKTNTKAKYLEKNKAQHGGCRIALDSIMEANSNKEIKGIYWTTSNTMGDMTLTVNE